ncbi:MAG TPA: alkaline phosphatase family protein [Solirubrobacter sp.]|nr:alkaline phosphatase family protein [Solirubrobacter sp.]
MEEHGGAGRGRRRTRIVGALAATAVAAGLAVPWVGEAHDFPWKDHGHGHGHGWGHDHGHGWGHDHGHGHDNGPNKLLFFASDGLRQDAVERYSAEHVTPGFRELLKHGAFASGHGLLTQAPPNTGAGWFTLATGAWPAVHGSTNNTFYINGTPFDPDRASSTGFNASQPAFPGGGSILQAETLAQSAERGGKKVAQIEWAGGRSAAIDGPTVDFRNFRSGRGVATNYISDSDLESFVRSLGVQFDHPSGFAGQAPFAGAAPTAATGWSHVPRSYSPAKEMRLRVLDDNIDKYGLNAYIYDSRNDHRTRYDRVLFSTTKSGDDAVANLREGEWADVKVTIQQTPGESADPLAGKRAAFLIKVERLDSDLSHVRLFHTSVTRAIASWPDWPGERGFSGSFEDFVAERFPSSQAGDFAVLESGVVSEDTYIEQGQYWEKLYFPLIRYILDRYKPDLAMIGNPSTDEVQHQFLGLVTRKLPNGANNPAYDDVGVDGGRDGRVREREAYIREAYESADETMRLAQDRMHDRDLTTFVSSDHGFAPQFAAIDASKVLVNLGLLSTSQTSNCRLAAGETIGKAKACWAGGTVQVYLNLEDREQASGYQQVASEDEAQTVAAIKAAFLALKDPNDWTGDNRPEGWKVIDRVYTKAEARYIPNGDDSTADMAHPTRTGDVVAFSYPPYQFDAATPGTLIARSAFFGQHGYVPDVQDLRSNTNMRATFLAGGDAIERGRIKDVRSIDLAPTAAFLLGVPEPEKAQGTVRRDLLDDARDYTPVPIVALNDFHGQLEPTSFPMDNGTASVGGASFLATMFDEERAALPGETLLLSGGDNVSASPPISALLDDMPSIDALNAWGVDATAFGNHEFDHGPDRIIAQQARSDFPWLSSNIVETSTGEPPPYVKPSVVLRVNGVRVGVIGATVKNTPELVAAGNTAGLTFLDEGPSIERESNRLRRQGVRVQVVVIHEGADTGNNATGLNAPTPWTGRIVDEIVPELQDTTIDLVVAGHTHRATNTVVGHIPVVEGYNAGETYSVAQLMVKRGDVAWAGTATRIAKNLGVAPRPDVKAIVDQAAADTAVLRNQVIGTQSIDILRAPDRLEESAMGHLVTDAMLEKYPGVDAALTNSGGLRQDLFLAPTADEERGEITWAEVFSVLPFGNRTVIETVTFDQLVAAFENGLKPPCGDSSGGTGRTPQFAGLKVTFHCNGTVPVVDSITKPDGSPLGATIRLVTNDFMYTGGDGYTALSGGADVLQPGDDLVDVTIDYIAAHSPVAPTVTDANRRMFGPE